MSSSARRAAAPAAPVARLVVRARGVPASKRWLTEASVGRPEDRSRTSGSSSSWTARSRSARLRPWGNDPVGTRTPSPKASTRAAGRGRISAVLVVGEDERRRVPGRRLAKGADHPPARSSRPDVAGGCSSQPLGLARDTNETLRQALRPEVVEEVVPAGPRPLVAGERLPEGATFSGLRRGTLSRLTL